jgi:pseudaminic acid biosynthesis-associated methylase
MAKISTPQEEFWAGSFGDEYIQRNQGLKSIASNIALFSRILASTRGVETVVEFGANIGLNLHAISALLPDASLTGIELNANAAAELAAWKRADVIHESIISLDTPRAWDFVLIKGVLIHINPDSLPAVYENLMKASSRYVCVIEYYNPSPVSINYRGHDDRLFKRDFAGEMMSKYPSLRLVDYGFAYRRDPNFPQDDVTWFLMEKA